MKGINLIFDNSFKYTARKREGEKERSRGEDYK